MGYHENRSGRDKRTYGLCQVWLGFTAIIGLLGAVHLTGQRGRAESSCPTDPAMMAEDRLFDLVIRQARVIDPESGFDQVADIGILGNAVAAISTLCLAGKETIDASGLVAAPGFIDIDTITYPKPATYRNVEYWKLADGVTSIAWLHDGAPSVDYILQNIAGLDHLINWGFGLRVDALYDKANSLSERVARLDAELACGGLGIGMSPEYTPFMTTSDLIEYARIAAKHHVPVVIHTRYAFKNQELEGIREAIEIARRSGGHVHLLHLHSTGATFHMPEALDFIDQARSQGVRVDGSVYPYSYWMTPISNPNRFKKGWQRGLGLEYSDLYFVPLRRTLTKELFEQYHDQPGSIVVPEDTISWESSILPALAKDYIFFGSDGSCEVPVDRAKTVFAHPRDTGNFATALALIRKRDLSLMTLLAKMTIDPACFLEASDPEFKRRGRIKVGAYADITLFDPALVDGGGDIKDPNQTIAVSKGIVAVLVNGRIAYRQGEVAASGLGRFIRGVRNARDSSQ